LFNVLIAVFVRRQISGSFGFAKLWLVGGAKPNVPLAGWLKLFLKTCGGKKIKKIGAAMSVGLLVDRYLYRFYFFGRLSKWFTFSLFSVVCLLLSGRSLHLLPTENCMSSGRLRGTFLSNRYAV
jgi:hypothetical protein